MKLSDSIMCLGILMAGCGGNANLPPSGANSQTDQPPMAGMDHNHAMPMPSTASTEASVAPPTSSANSTGDTAPAAQGSSAEKHSVDLSTSPANSAAPVAPGAKGNLTVSINSTPASAAKSAVVYLEDAPKDKDVNGTMDNRQMAFIPHVLVVTAGAKITFSNSDPFPHNVFSPDHEKWDMGMIPAHSTRVRKFADPGVYTVLCNVHPNMKAYIVVVPSNYFAKADKSGETVIRDVPAGKHKLVVWAPGVKTEQQEVTIEGDKTVTVELHR